MTKNLLSIYCKEALGTSNLSRHNSSLKEHTILWGKTNNYNVMNPVKQAQEYYGYKKEKHSLNHSLT